MDSRQPDLFFGFGTGRTASMAIANALNNERSSLVLHEGKIRRGEVSGQQFLSFLTLENRLVYESPCKAIETVSKQRNADQIMTARGSNQYFGDIAYNYCPMVSALATEHPSAKFIFFYRNCVDFVPSSCALRGQDPAPVGWPPAGKIETKLEKFISLGRIQPRQGTPEAQLWQSWTHTMKNIWLWSETNKIAVAQLKEVQNAVYWFKFEDFVLNPLYSYSRLREFLGIEGEIPQSTVTLFKSRVNHRRGEVTPAEKWTTREKQHFRKYALPIMVSLGYSL